MYQWLMYRRGSEEKQRQFRRVAPAMRITKSVFFGIVASFAIMIGGSERARGSGRGEAQATKGPRGDREGD